MPFDILPVLALCLSGSTKTTSNSDTAPRDVVRRANAGRRSKGGHRWLQVLSSFFNSQKGFGFIQPQDGGKDVFVHISAVERAGMSSLSEGQKVSYDVVSERGKLAAGNLQAL